MRLPNDTQRCAVVGATGTGKTQAAAWQLSMRDYNLKPWIIIDFKGDELIGEIGDLDGSYQLGFNEPLPTRPGIYIVSPTPDQTEQVEALMWKIWAAGNVGLFIDEGFMIGRKNDAFRACLTQGRSKRIPMIVLSQRPVWMDQFVFSESEYFQVFRLNQRKDLQKVMEFIPYDLTQRLPEYHSYYYDVGADKLTKISAVPPADVIINTFAEKLATIPKAI